MASHQALTLTFVIHKFSNYGASLGEQRGFKRKQSLNLNNCKNNTSNQNMKVRRKKESSGKKKKKKEFAFKHVELENHGETFDWKCLEISWICITGI